MPIWLGVLVGFANCVIAFRNPKNGLALYVILALLAPHIDVGATNLSYEIAAFVPVFLVVLGSRRSIRKGNVYPFVLGYLGLVCAGTLSALFQYGGSLTVDWVRMAGLGRLVVLLFLLYELLDRRTIERIVLVAVLVNAVLAPLQLLLPGAAQLFLDLYGKESQTVLSRYMEMGGIPRSPGTFGSPVNLGFFGLLAFTLGYVNLLRGQHALRGSMLCLGGALTGVFSLTKTFLVGAPVILAAGLLLLGVSAFYGPVRLEPGKLRSRLLIGASLALVVLGAWMLQRFGFTPLYYLEFLVDPESSLATRYGAGLGTLAETLAVVIDNWATGVGMTRVRGEFIGDSSYVSILHASGIAGLALISVGVGALAWKALRERYLLLIVMVLVIAALALPVFLTLPGMLGVAYLLRSPDPGGSTRRTRSVASEVTT